jgi:hypothetical protein
MLKTVKNLVKRNETLRSILFPLYSMISGKPVLHFKNSAQYWEDRYVNGMTSGSGSYGRLAEFKAEFLNEFVADHKISSIVEFGCGDGAQLALAAYPKYWLRYFQKICRHLQIKVQLKRKI